MRGILNLYALFVCTCVPHLCVLYDRENRSSSKYFEIQLRILIPFVKTTSLVLKSSKKILKEVPKSSNLEFLNERISSTIWIVTRLFSSISPSRSPFDHPI